MELLSKWLGFTWAHPEYIQLQWLVCVAVCSMAVIIFLKKKFRLRRRYDAKFKVIGRDGAWIAFTVLIGLIAVALAGPQINGAQLVTDSGNLDIIFAFDESFSMAADDIKPSRHDVAVRIIRDLLATPAIHPGDRLTLFAFGDKSRWLMPLSTDPDEFMDKLSDIEHPKNKKYVDGNQLSTDIDVVLEHIPGSLARQDNYYKTLHTSASLGWVSHQRVVIFITDGDDYPGSLVNTLVKKYKQEGIPIYAVALGTTKGTTLQVKVVDEKDPKKFNPLRIHTSLNTKSLKKIVTDGDQGIYIVSSNNNSAVSFINAVLSKNRSNIPHLVLKDNPDHFWWPVLASSIIFMIIMILII